MMALLAARMLPAMVLAVPLFVIGVDLGLTDTTRLSTLTT